MTVLVVRAAVLQAAFADPKYTSRLEKAKSVAEVQAIMAEYCKAKGFKAVEVSTK